MTNQSYDCRCLINGVRVAALSGNTFDCIFPIDGRLLAQVARADQSDADVTMAAALVV